MKTIEPIEGERWVAVPGFPSYSVSDLGRFKRSSLSGEYELRGKRDRYGYHMIGLVRGGVQLWFLSHRVVACAFFDQNQLESPQGRFLTVNHKDRDRSNNQLSNLELVSVADNNRHWRKHTLGGMRG